MNNIDTRVIIDDEADFQDALSHFSEDEDTQEQAAAVSKNIITTDALVRRNKWPVVIFLCVSFVFSLVTCLSAALPHWFNASTESSQLGLYQSQIAVAAFLTALWDLVQSYDKLQQSQKPQQG